MRAGLSSPAQEEGGGGGVAALLLGVTGSRAHGLERDDSDTDMRGVYAEPTERVLGLEGAPQANWHTEGHVMWEARQAIRLALQSSPTVTELLHLPGYEELTEDGWDLVSLRSRLVSREQVYRSYLSNAESQLTRLKARRRVMRKMDYRGDREVDERWIRKRARHIAISVVQGSALWKTGGMTVRLANAERDVVLDAEANPDVLPTLIRRLYRVTERESALPEAPDTEAAEQWLLRVRERNWKRDNRGEA